MTDELDRAKNLVAKMLAVSGMEKPRAVLLADAIEILIQAKIAEAVRELELVPKP